MTKYYLQAEAFNIAHVIYDTYDISTIRGGSFMLLAAIKHLENAVPGLTSIATAASSGLFTYEDSGNLEAQKESKAKQVLKALNDFTEGHATFLVAVEEDKGNFTQVIDLLEADLRRQQWRMPTVVVPPFASTDQECYFDGWRPGVVPYAVDELEGVKISEAARFRRKIGRTVKQHIYSQLLGKPIEEDDLVARDLGKLAMDDSKGILNGKIALIQVDGNSFGRIRRKTCDTASRRSAFDDKIQKDCRERFLRDLRMRASSDPDFQFKEGDRTALRIELLMWGGDEFTLVVPAWKGLEVLERFFHFAGDLQVESGFGTVPMTHRAAVIFCHYDAPILQIRRLAEELLSRTKKNITKKFGEALDSDPSLASLTQEDRTRQLEWLSNARYGNAARYLVLESFDMLRGSLGQFLDRYYGKGQADELLLYGHQMPELRDYLYTVRSAVSKGQVVRIAKAVAHGDEDRLAELSDRLTKSISPSQREAVLAAIHGITNGDKAGWYILADLWDYAEEWKA